MPALREAAVERDVAAPASAGTRQRHRSRGITVISPSSWSRTTSTASGCVEVRRLVRLVAAVGEHEVRRRRRAPGAGRTRGPVSRRPPASSASGASRRKRPRYVGRQIALPAARQHHPPVAHQPAVAGSTGGFGSRAGPEGRPRGVVEVRERTTMLPRFTTSTSTRPLARARSTGSRSETSAAKPTRPAASRGASARSVIGTVRRVRRIDG